LNTNWKKNIALFLTAQTLTLFGSSLVQYAIMWHITLETQSGTMMMFSIICGFLPTFFLSPFAGVWADRYNRKLLIIISDTVIAFSTLVLALLFLAGFREWWLLFVIIAIRALGTAVHVPAVGAIIPQIVPKEKLTRINAINGSIQSLTMIAAPMLSALLYTVASIEAIFFIDVATAAIGILTLLFFLNVPTHEKALEKQTTGYFSDLREGIVYIMNHGYLKRFFLYCLFFFFLVAPVAFLTPLQVTRTFGADVWRLMVFEITFATGMILGGAILAAWGGFKNKIHTMTLSSLITGICTLMLGLAPNFWIYLFFSALAGIALPLFNTPSTVLLQEKVEQNFLGRVFGIFGMIMSSMMPIGMLLFGPLADIVKIEWLLIITGLMLFFQSFYLVASKVLIEAGKPPEKV